MPSNPHGKSKQVNLMLDRDVYIALEDRASGKGIPMGIPGRISGVTEYIRRLIYKDLNMDLPPDPGVMRGREVNAFNAAKRLGAIEELM